MKAGDRLGPYSILDKLGEGGMGEVYRARDARLGRDVALKVLRTESAGDPDRMARFEQEAKATAALNHPNIVAVYDVGIDAQPYVVSELLTGETLRQALSRGALTQKTATDVTIQTARGLAAAHQRGIVHRDLKPENIFLTSDGHAKILDFGLAKLIPTSDLREGSSVPATTLAMTTPGIVMGTVGYMSPEQVRGEPADARTDVFALGAVFYEMLSGQRAFAGSSPAEAMSAILRDEPPELSGVRHDVPIALDRIIRRCIEKKPEQRFQSAGDVAFALEAISGSSLARASVAAPRRVPWRAVAFGAAMALAGAAAVLLLRGPGAAPAEPVNFQARTFDRLPITNARFMPDGQTIVYSAASRGYAPDLYVISPNTEGPRPLGVTNAQLLSISSSGELAIIMDARHVDQRLFTGTLARMTIGSTPRPMLEGVREADWSPDGSALAIIRDLGNSRDRLEYPAGTARHEVSGYLSDPRVSPDGARVAFFEHQTRFDDRGWVKVVDRAGIVSTLGGEFWGLEGLAWSPDGSSLVFSGNAAGGYFMQPMSVNLTGGPARTVFGVPGRFIVYDVARDGRWLAVREDLSFGVRARVPGQTQESDLSWLGSVGARSMSDDGQWLLMVDAGPSGGSNYGVVLRKTDGSQALRLGEGNPQRLSPDGKWAAAIVAAPPQLVAYPTGAGEPVRIDARAIERGGTVEWFPDSQRMLLCGAEASRAPRCYEQDLAGAAPKPLTDEGVVATLSPDGTRLLMTLPNGTFQLSALDGGAPQPVMGLRSDDRRIRWSRDGRAIFVQRGLEVPAVVERVELATGRRTTVATIDTEGLGSVTQITVKDWVDDGRWYVYNYTTVPSALFVVSGAK